jgi:hypothetical protein
MSSNPIQGIDVCVFIFVFVFVLCVGSGFATGWSRSATLYVKMAQQKAVELLMNEYKA